MAELVHFINRTSDANQFYHVTVILNIRVRFLLKPQFCIYYNALQYTIELVEI